MKSYQEPAFPSGNPTLLMDGTHRDGEFGMTLRDYAAIHFESAMLASPELLEVVTKLSITDGSTATRLADVALKYADAFLEARK